MLKMFSEFSSDDIKKVQTVLKIPLTGEMDNLTIAGVKNYQHRENISYETAMCNLIDSITSATEPSIYDIIEDTNLSTDLMETLSPMVQNKFLDGDQYFKGPTPKSYIFYHHTSGWSNPFNTRNDWNTDSRGKIGTEYIIGGMDPRTGDETNDGIIVRCFNSENYAYHLGAVDSYMHSHSVGIELCNIGFLTKRGSNFYTYTGAKVNPKYVTELSVPFRGYKYWASYSDAQLDSLHALTIQIANQHSINLEIGLKDRINKIGAAAFEYYDDAKNGKIKGLLSHTNVRKDKTDVYPCPRLMEMIKSL